MGIANPDHVLTHDAGLLAREELIRSGTEIVWFCYEWTFAPFESLQAFTVKSVDCLAWELIPS